MQQCGLPVALTGGIQRGLLRHRERPSAELSFQLIKAEKANYPVALMCRVLGVGTSSFYDWQARRSTPSARSVADAELTERIRAIHTMSRASYGSPRVWSELRLGDGVQCSRKRVERLMRLAGLQGLHRPKFRGCTRRNPNATPSEDLVNRQFSVEGPDRLWVSDITEHATAEGKVYVAVVLDAWSRRGRGLVDRRSHPSRACGRRPADGGVAPAPTRGPGHLSLRPRVPIHLLGVRPASARRRRAGLDGIHRGRVRQRNGESFFSTLQRELLDEHRWETRRQLAIAVFEWIEGWYNPRRRHSSIGNISPIDYEARFTPAAAAA